MATIDEDLSQIERDIRTLKIEYEQFFGGGRPRPPADTQWRVDTLIRRYNERTAELGFGQRFRFNNLAQTYAKYQEMWRKKTMQKEGATHHHFGAAAKAIEAERARKAAIERSAAPPERPAGASGAAREAAHPRASAAGFALSFTDPEQEKEKLEILYQRLIEARVETGESAGAPSLKDFERFVLKKTKELKAAGAHHEVEYTVTIEGHRVKLKARISS